MHTDPRYIHSPNNVNNDKFTSNVTCKFKISIVRTRGNVLLKPKLKTRFPRSRSSVKLTLAHWRKKNACQCKSVFSRRFRGKSRNKRGGGKKRKRRRHVTGEVTRQKDAIRGIVAGLPGCAIIIGREKPYLTRARPSRGRVSVRARAFVCTRVSVRVCTRANSCHSPGQGVLQRYIPCRCSVFSLGTPFFATRAKGGYGSVPLRSPCHHCFLRIAFRSLSPSPPRSLAADVLQRGLILRPIPNPIHPSLPLGC